MLTVQNAFTKACHELRSVENVRLSGQYILLVQLTRSELKRWMMEPARV
jgi:hypothetical protein